MLTNVYSFRGEMSYVANIADLLSYLVAIYER